MKINTYKCPSCQYETVTVEYIDGVTPAFMECRNPNRDCRGMAESSWYRCDQSFIPAWAWYKPDGEELMQLIKDSPYAAGHVAKGGLLLKQIGDM